MFEWVSLSRHIYRKILSFLESSIILRSLPNIIIVAPQNKDLLVKKTNAKIFTIPNGIDLKDSQDISPKSIEHPAILYVGRLTKRKGVDVLLKGIPAIKKVFPNLLLYIIGTGQQQDELKRLVKELNIEDNVKFLGFVSEEEKYSYYKSVDVCIVPSIDYDYAPVVLPEAMASERPIIASSVGGIPFMVEDGKTGLLVDPGNIEALAEKIIILLQNNELREKMGKAGKEKIINFSWEVIAEQTVDVYKEVIKDHRCKRI
jgi:glycosyltransferase involved in cell wall biosynthesis